MESNFLHKINEYDYRKTPAFLKMENILKKIKEEEKIEVNEEGMFQKLLKKESQCQEETYLNDIKYEEDPEKLRNILLGEEKREKQLIEKKNKLLIELIERELEFEQILYNQKERKKEISVFKDSKEMNVIKNLNEEIKMRIEQMKKQMGENIVRKEKNIIYYYNQQIEELKEMFKKEFELQIKK